MYLLAKDLKLQHLVLVSEADIKVVSLISAKRNVHTSALLSSTSQLSGNEPSVGANPYDAHLRAPARALKHLLGCGERLSPHGSSSCQLEPVSRSHRSLWKGAQENPSSVHQRDQHDGLSPQCWYR